MTSVEQVGGALLDRTTCPICGVPAPVSGRVYGAYSDRTFTLRKCAVCDLSYLEDPSTDFARIYDDAYYDGKGADPLVDYRFELNYPTRTIRSYEWQGILTAVRELAGCRPGCRWLDFGAGNGGLVRYLREHANIDAVGFDEGSMAAESAARGIPFLSADELEARRGTFDVVTAIEVLEHVLDPLAELRQIRRLLRPGGLLFMTTGNAASHLNDITRWRYVVPEIHISYFAPATLERALTLVGLRPAPLGPTAGVDDILKFKVLKNLRIRQRSCLTDALPSTALGLVAERVARMRDMPIGWA